MTVLEQVDSRHQAPRSGPQRARVAHRRARRRGGDAARHGRPSVGRDRARPGSARRAGRRGRRRSVSSLRDDLLATRRRRGGRGAGRHLSGMPHARPAPALQSASAQRAADPLPQLPAHAVLAARRRRGQRIASTGACRAPEEVEQPLADTAGGKSGLHRAGWPLTAAPGDRGKVPQRRDRRGRVPAARVKRRGKSSPGPFVRTDAR